MSTGLLGRGGGVTRVARNLSTHVYLTEVHLKPGQPVNISPPKTKARKLLSIPSKMHAGKPFLLFKHLLGEHAPRPPPALVDGAVFVPKGPSASKVFPIPVAKQCTRLVYKSVNGLAPLYITILVHSLRFDSPQ